MLAEARRECGGDNRKRSKLVITVHSMLLLVYFSNYPYRRHIRTILQIPITHVPVLEFHLRFTELTNTSSLSMGAFRLVRQFLRIV